MAQTSGTMNSIAKYAKFANNCARDEKCNSLDSADDIELKGFILVKISEIFTGHYNFYRDATSLDRV